MTPCASRPRDRRGDVRLEHGVDRGRLRVVPADREGVQRQPVGLHGRHEERRRDASSSGVVVDPDDQPGGRGTGRDERRDGAGTRREQLSHRLPSLCGDPRGYGPQTDPVEHGRGESAAAPKRTGSSAGSPVSASAAAIAARAAASSSVARVQRDRDHLRRAARAARSARAASTSSASGGIGNRSSSSTNSTARPCGRARRRAVRCRGAARASRPSRRDGAASPGPRPRAARRRRATPSSTSCSAAPAMKSETTASTAIPQPAIAIPVWPVGTNSLAMPRRLASRVELERDGHLPDRAVRADRAARRSRRASGSRRSGRSGRRGGLRRSRSSTPCRAASSASSRIVGDELVQAVLDVEAVRDAAPSGARATPAGSGRPGSRRRRARSSARAAAPPRPCRRSGSPSCVSPARVRVEDRDDLLGPVAHHAAGRLPVVRVGREALGEDQQPTRRATPSPGRSEGRWTPSTNSTPGQGSLGEQQVAVEVDVVAEARDRAPRRRSRGPDSTMQPSITPSPSARAAFAIRTASRMPPDFASLIVDPVRPLGAGARRRRACGSPRRRRSGRASARFSSGPARVAARAAAARSTGARICGR